MISGHIQRKLGPIRAALADQLRKAPMPGQLYEPTDTDDEKKYKLTDHRLKLTNHLAKLIKSIENVESADREWGTIMTSQLTVEEREAEQAKYEEHAVNGYMPLLIAAQDVRINIESKLTEIAGHLADITSSSWNLGTGSGADLCADSAGGATGRCGSGLRRHFQIEGSTG